MTKECVWTLDNYDHGYETSCNNRWCFLDGDLKENKTKYCPFCGKKIREVSHDKR